MISIINYGLGNIRAFENIFNLLNLPFSVASSKIDLEKAEKIILPGVGSFDHAMKLLNKSGMREILERKVLDQKIPILGICVGMQILGLSSEEGSSNGLGFIDGEVKKFPSSDLNNLPLPHMGWNNINFDKNIDIFYEVKRNPYFYFLHSYYFECKKADNIISYADYGKEFVCAVKKGNVYGVQFHPEKSHENGIKVLRNFGTL